MEVERTELDGVLLIRLEPFEDFRGHFVALYSKNGYKLSGMAGLYEDFVEDDISVSRKGVLRGIHCDSEAWKLLTCLYGTVYLVIVGCDTESETFGKWQPFTLAGNSFLQVLVPPKHGIGHLVLSDEAILHYKQNQFFQPDRQSTFAFDDERFNIYWPIQNPILSKRDEGVRRCHQEA